MADANLSIKVNAENLASGHLKEVEESAGGLGEQLKSVAEIAEGIGLAELGNKIAEHLGEAITAVSSLGDATYKLSQTTGMSAENASAWISALNKFGVDADATNKSLGIFEKNLENISNGASSSKSFKTSMDELGIEVHNTNGSLKDMNDVMLDVADRFQQMPDGPEKTAIAMNLFGKSGKDLIPILDEGSDAIKEAMDDAKKYGLTLTGDNVEAVRNFGIAHRELDEAIEGVEVQIGVALMPVLSRLVEAVLAGAQAFNTGIMPAVKEFGQFLGDTVAPEIEQAGEIINRVIGGDVDASFRDVFGDNGIAQVLDKYVAVVREDVAVLQELLSGDLVGAFNTLRDNAVPLLADFGATLVSNLTRWGEEFVDWIAPNIDPMLHQLGQMLTDMTGWMVDTALPAVLQSLLKWGVAFVEWVAPHIPPLLLELDKLLVELGVWIVTTAIPAIVEHLLKWAAAFLDWVATDVVPKIPPTFQAIIDAIGSWLSSTAIPWAEQRLADLGSAMLNAIVGAFKALGNSLQQALIDAFNAIHVDVGPLHLSASGFHIDAPSLPAINFGSQPGQFGPGPTGSGPVPTGVGTTPQSTGNSVLTPFLSSAEILAFCGPIAAEAVANTFGKGVDIPTLKLDALTAGWTPGGGMNGTGNFQRLMDMLGVDMSFGSVAQAEASSSAVFSTPEHYFESTGYNPATGKFHVGNSGLVFKGGATDMTLAQIEALGGGLNGILVPSAQRGGDAMGLGAPAVYTPAQSAEQPPIQVCVYIGDKQIEDLHVETHTRAQRRGRL